MRLPRAMPMLAVMHTVGRATSSISNGSRSTSSSTLGDELGAAVRRRALDEDDELVTAEPGDRVAFAQGGEQAGRDRLQELVARFVAERVVDLLEAVEVEEQHGGLGAGAAGAGLHLLDAVEDERAVRQAGERVVQRLVADAFEQAGVADRDRRLARDAAQATGELGVVDHALRAFDDVTDDEADALVVHDDRDGCDRGRAELVHQHRQHVQVRGALAVPDGDGGVAGARAGNGNFHRTQTHFVARGVADGRDDAAVRCRRARTARPRRGRSR